MKKLLSLLTLLVCAMGASAQEETWTNPHQEQPANSTVIYADFIVENGQEWEAAYSQTWEFGVFVGGECRLSGNMANPTYLKSYNNQPYLEFKVPGYYGTDDDEGKAITIKVRNSMSEVYTITPSETLTYNEQKTYGTQPSGPRVQLKLTKPTSVTLSGFSINAGDEKDLTTCVKLAPDNAQLPDNVRWYIGSDWSDTSYSDYATLTDATLNALKPYIVEGENTAIPYGLAVDGGNFNLLATAEFTIEQPATSIEIVTESFDTYKNDQYGLNLFMMNNNQTLAYKTNPTEITEEVKWEYYSEYIELQDGAYVPIKGGETQIRPYIERAEGNLYPADNKWITVNITVPVESITFNWPDNVTFKANVGDELYQRIADRVTILPEDATDKGFTISTANASVVSVNKSVVTAAGAGTTTLTLTPMGMHGEGVVYPTVNVQVFNPVKEVAFADDPLYIDAAEAEIADVQTIIANNIEGWGAMAAGQSGTISFDGVLTGGGSITANGPKVNLTNNEMPKGNTTVNVTLSWRDYSSYNGTANTIKTATGEAQSFQVIISMGLDHFNIAIVADENDPTSGTITLTPVPADADFDWADYQNILSIYPEAELGDWNVIDVKGREGVYTYSATLPGYYLVYYGVDEPESFEVPAKVTFESGWQWKSNNYAPVRGNKDLFEFFGDEMAEARTYDDLLYNDTNWGYWGSLYDKEYAIDPFQMYKVKMTAARETYLYGGDLPIESIDFFDLKQGWNWIGSPYFFKRTLDNAFADAGLAEGTVIVGKTGSAEFTGSVWSGNLNTIDPAQGYYIYLPEAMDVLTLSTELGFMSQGDDVAAARAARQSVWSYDHTRFANNMTMVAELNDIANPEQYTIGAFVDGECRGEGIIENGLAFITVHANAGEQVSLQLHNELTGEFFDIDQTFRSGAMRVGSLKAPVQLSSNAVVTGVNAIERSALNIERYDLGGRRVANSQKGISIQRSQNGMVKKVVK